MSDLSKTYLGQYQLIEPIGHGGMSTVYKAYQASLDRHVAVKVLLSNHDAQFASRFRREARAVATLQHPNILPIYDYGEQSTLAYFVMQYVENGVTLQERLGTPLAPTEAVPLIGQVLSALEYAHARGIVHRDIKPANVLLPAPTWAMLADFGIAKLVNDSQHLTLTGFIIGTAAYMAPEQAAGRPVDARTDLYSVGVMLYELLAGQPPFYADTPMALLTQHVYDPPPPPRTINPQIHPAVEEALLQALAKHPDDRYQNAAEMRADLERVLTLLGKPYVSPRVTDLYNAGVQAFQAQRWDEAVDRLNRALMLDPDHDDAAGLLDLAREERNAARRQYARSPANTNPRPAVAAVGTTIGQAARNPPAARPQRIRCPECGRVVQSDWQICPYCRTAIAPETPAQATPLATPAISPPAAVADAPSVPIALGAPVELTPASLGPRPAPLPAAASPSALKPAITSPLAAAIAEPAGRSRAVWPALLAGVVLLAVVVAIWRPWRSSGTGGANGQAIVEPAASGAPALIGATRTITPSATLTSTPTDTPAPTSMPAPTSTPTDTPTPTSTPTDTPAPTEPPKPTATPKPKPTARPKPSATPEPPPTATPEPPTATPEPPTATPEPPTATPEPSRPRKTPTPEG